MLNPVLLNQLEGFGLTNEDLQLLLAVCERGIGRATWHIGPSGLGKFEVTLFAAHNDSRRMRDLTQLLQKDQ